VEILFTQITRGDKQTVDKCLEHQISSKNQFMMQKFLFKLY